MDNSYQIVLEALSKASSQNIELLKDAERQLKSLETQPGFYSTLLNIAFDQNCHINIRWVSIICVKNGVDMYWTSTITTEEKCAIRLKLQACLNEPINQIAEQSAVIIAKIFSHDFPEDWKELFPVLLNGFQSTEQLHHLRALLTGHYILKNFVVKGSHDMDFVKIAPTILPTIVRQWINYSKLFLEVAQTDATKSSQLLESAFLSLKMLRKLVTGGFKDECKDPDAIYFLTLIFQQFGPFLECRTVLINQDHMLETCEKYIVLLVKVLKDVLVRMPLTFMQFIRPALECSFTWCFNQDFQDRVFERLIVRFLKLIKWILLSCKYDPERFGDCYDQDDDTEKEKCRVIEADKTRMEFCTFPFLKEICQQMLTRYIPLSINDLNTWENDPEGFAAEEIGFSCKVSLRACSEDFYLGLVGHFHESLKPFVAEVIKSLQTNSSTDIIEILKKDAVYYVMGSSACSLRDDIDFGKWFTESLIPELIIEEKGYYIIRRRVIWLIGQWCKQGIEKVHIPLLYDIIVQSLSSDGNLVVRLTAAKTLQIAVEIYHEDLILPHLEKSISSLCQLLLQVKDGDLKVSLLNVLSIIIKFKRKEVKPYLNSLIHYLPQLWETCGDHNRLRCAIISCFVHLVEIFQIGSESLESPLLLQLIAFCTDVSQPTYVCLLEDGLQLWWAILNYSTICTPEILNFAQIILHTLERNHECFKICLEIVEAYMLLSPEYFFKRHGHELVKILQSSLADFKSYEMNIFLKFLENALTVFPEYSVILFLPFLPLVLNITLEPNVVKLSWTESSRFNRRRIFRDDNKCVLNMTSELGKVFGKCLCVLSRVILHDQTCFINVLQEKANESKKNVNVLLGEVLDIWSRNIPFLSYPNYKKIVALALVRMLTSASEIIHDKFCDILQAVVQVLKVITKDGGGVSDDKCLYTIQKDEFFFDVVRNCNSHYSRLLKARDIIDPVLHVVLRDYFYDQMKTLEQSVGPEKFRDLMFTVNNETKEEVQFYIQI